MNVRQAIVPVPAFRKAAAPATVSPPPPFNISVPLPNNAPSFRPRPVSHGTPSTGDTPIAIRLSRF